MLKKIIYISSITSILCADSLIYTNPSLIHTLSDKNHLELDLTNRYIPSYGFDGSVKIPSVAQKVSVRADSQAKTYFLPQLYYVAPKIGDLRFGFSVTPYICNTRKISWGDRAIGTYTKDYDIGHYAITPTLSYKLSDTLAIAGGVNIARSKVSQSLAHQNNLYALDLDGEGVGYSYNLSISAFLAENLVLSLNGSTKTNIKIKGTAAASYGKQNINSDASADIVLPSEMSARVAYIVDRETSVFCSYKKRFWSQYRELDLNFENQAAESLFGKPVAKNWRDMQIVSFGVKKSIERFIGSATVGFATTPVNPSTMDMSYPVTDSRFATLEAGYKLTDFFSVGAKATFIQQDAQVLDNQVYQGTLDAAMNRNVTLFFKSIF